MVNQPAGNAVLELLQAYPDRIQFRLGVQFRFPRLPLNPAETPVPARYVRVQIASPPPDRSDRKPWYSGLLVVDGSTPRSFKPEGSDWANFAVYPNEDLPQLANPKPETVLFDQWVAVRAVPARDAITTVFKLAGPAPGDRAFISVQYPPPIVLGSPLGGVAGVAYYLQGECEFEFKRTAGRWLAVSFDGFQPKRDRPSADYIVKVDETPNPTIAPVEDQVKIERWW